MTTRSIWPRRSRATKYGPTSPRGTTSYSARKMDCFDETLARQVTPYYRAFRELGYRYVKSDSLRRLIYDGLMEPETARTRHRTYLEAARRALGKDVYYLFDIRWGYNRNSV